MIRTVNYGCACSRNTWELTPILKNYFASDDQIYSGNTLAKQIGAVRYIETSALTGEGVQDAFDAAVEAGLMEPRAGCCQVQW